MAPKKMPWFRFYAETVSDRKIRRLKVEHRWLWVVVLCAARQSPEPGRLLLADDQPIDHVDLADLGAMSERAVKDGLKALHAGGLIEDDNGTWVVPKWADRQFVSDNSTARASASKKRSKEQESNDDATLHQRSMQPPCNVPETETETDGKSKSTHALTTRGPNLLEDDISELRVRRIGRHITEDPDESVLREVRLMLHEIPDADDVTIALAVAR